MTKKKSGINWYFLIVGLTLLYFGFSFSKSTKRNIQSRKITVVLSKDMINVKGRKSKIDYRFFAEEYQNQFIILKGSITRGRHEDISSLKGGQEIEITIAELDFNKLGRSHEEITIMGLSINERNLMSEVEFNENRSLYKRRLAIFSFFGGLMLIFNGLILIPKKINYAIVSGFLGSILIMRILEFGIY